MKSFICEYCKQSFNLKSKFFLCKKCNKLNKLPNNIDYFTYFNIPLNFPINLNILEKKYINLLSLYHPDNFVNASEEEQINAICHSSFVNQAYMVLKSDKKLIIYMYNLLTENQLDTEAIEPSPELSEFFFNLNEELLSLNKRKEKNDFRHKIQDLYNQTVEEISNSFRIKNYEKIKNYLFSKLSYIDKLKDRLK